MILRAVDLSSGMGNASVPGLVTNNRCYNNPHTTSTLILRRFDWEGLGVALPTFEHKRQDVSPQMLVDRLGETLVKSCVVSCATIAMEKGMMHLPGVIPNSIARSEFVRK